MVKARNHNEPRIFNIIHSTNRALMSEIEATIAVAGAIIVTIIGSVVAYLLQERGAKRALKQEVALRPYVDKVTALKTVYTAMMDCAYLLSANTAKPPSPASYQQNFGDPIDQFTRVLYSNGIWLSKVESKLLDVLGVFRQTAIAMMPSTPPGTINVPWADLIQKPSIAGKAIADELGIDILEQQLNSLMSGLRVPTSGTAATQPVTQNPSQNPNRETELLKVNLAADYRLGWLLAMVGVYFAIIVGFLVAWYEKYSSNANAFYYVGAFLIIGAFGALFITQELLPYKHWFKQLDEWFRMIEINQRIPGVSKLVEERDRLESFRRLIFINIVLVEVLLTLLGYPWPWVLVGAIVAIFVVGFLTRERTSVDKQLTEASKM
jgi:hypothetical protein